MYCLLIVSGNEEITIDEIGEINDFIQREAGGSANIIMGIGEDETLNDFISVTVIATGFNTEDQVQIVPKEPKKIVHTLLDDAKPLIQKVEAPIAEELEEVEEESPVFSEPEAITHSLDEVEDQEPEQTISFSLDELDEEVEEETPEAPVTEPDVAFESKVVADPESVVDQDESEERVMFTLDLEEEETPMAFDAMGADNTEETENNHAITFELRVEEEDEAQMSETHSSPRLEDHLGLDGSIEENPDYLRSQPEQRSDETIATSLFDAVEEEVPVLAGRAEEKAVDTPVSTATLEVEEPLASEMVDPSEESLAEIQIQKARERKARLKAFNYRFKNVPNGLEDIENEPAFKRQGIDLENVPHSSEAPISRFTLSDSDEDGTTEIKSKNSFLHDNVD
jgi:cell division protein FtsZ